MLRFRTDLVATGMREKADGNTLVLQTLGTHIFVILVLEEKR